MAEASRSTRVQRQLIAQAKILGGLVALMWVFQVVIYLWPGQPSERLGIQPRTVSGLARIPLAPFVNHGFDQLMANTIPVVILGWLVLIRSTRIFFVVTVFVILVGGLGVWLVGRTETLHSGANGLILGYFGFLVFRGFLERSVPSVVIAVAVAVLYGGLFWGIVPSESNGSWESQLCGFVSGAMAAWLFVPHAKIPST